MADSVDTISAATGISRPDMLALWGAVKANQSKLDSCSRHDFVALEPARRLGGKYRCSVCGGEADSHSVHWYQNGLKHAEASRGG